MTRDEIIATVSHPAFKRFLNGVKLLRYWLPPGDNKLRRKLFLADPIDFFIKAGDETKAEIWRAIEAQQPKQPRSFPADDYRDTAAQLRNAVMDQDEKLLRAHLSNKLSVILGALDDASRT